MSKDPIDLKQYKDKCFKTFKLYDYDVHKGQRDELWHFLAAKGDKRYAIFCRDEVWETSLFNTESFVKEVMAVMKMDIRPVYVCRGHEENQGILADDFGFCLISLEKIEYFYLEMNRIKLKDEKAKHGLIKHLESEIKPKKKAK